MVQRNGNLVVFACGETLMRSILRAMGANLVEARRGRGRRFVSASTRESEPDLRADDPSPVLLEKISALYRADPVAALDPRSNASAVEDGVRPPVLEMFDASGTAERAASGLALVESEVAGLKDGAVFAESEATLDDGLRVLSLAFQTDGGVVDADVARFVRALPPERCGVATCHWFEGLGKRLLTSGNLRDGGPFVCGERTEESDPFELFCEQDAFATAEQWEAFLAEYGAEAYEDAPIANAQVAANRRLAQMIGDADL